MTHSHKSMFLVLAAALTLGPSACDTGTGDTHGDHMIPEADDYVDGLQKDTENGSYTVKLTSDPAPPTKGVNMWMIEVSDAAGPVTGANITVEPFMPEHGHGSDSVANVSDEDEGMYHAHPVELQMLGVWDTTITIEKDGVTDTVHFVFDVEGEGDSHDHDHNHDSA